MLVLSVQSPVAAMKTHPPTSNVAVGASPAASVFAGSASMPAPTVVPATNAAPMTVLGASSGTALMSLGRGSFRGGGVSSSAGRTNAIKISRI